MYKCVSTSNIRCVSNQWIKNNVWWMVSCKFFSKITVKFFKTNMKVAASNLNTKPNQPRFFWHQKKQEGGGGAVGSERASP